MAELIEIEQARAAVLEASRRLEAESASIDAADGRVLAEDVLSLAAVPGFDNSAMDGFAVRSADLSGAGSQKALRVIGESRAGAPAGRGPAEGEAVAISTGAVLPGGADAVVRVEDTKRRGETVEIAVPARPGQNIRRAGEDVEAGARVLRAGTEIGAAELGVLAAVGASEVRCVRRARVAVVATGDELRLPGEPLGPGEIHNSNAYSVPALARAEGAVVEVTPRVGDSAGATSAALELALRCDLAVICGGVSVGEHDHVKEALAELGVEPVFWGVALKPGKPTYFGAHPGGLVLGLPGNPVSAMVTFILFGRPILRSMLGLDPAAKRTTATLAERYGKRPGRAEAIRCALELRPEGWLARPAPQQGSHQLTSMLGADALALLPAEAKVVEAGERVPVELLES